MLQQNWLTLTKAKYVKIHFKQNKTKQIRGRVVGYNLRFNNSDDTGSNPEQTWATFLLLMQRDLIVLKYCYTILFFSPIAYIKYFIFIK